MERFNGTVALDDAALEAVNGGATIVGFSVANQEQMALARRLADAYLKNHPVELGPSHVLDR